MKLKLVVALSVFWSVQLFAQYEKGIESKITNVTVFLNKAQVTRGGKSKIESGKTNLVFTGLTSQLDPESIQVTGKGKFIVLGVSHRQNYLTELNMPKTFRSLKDSVEYLQRQAALHLSEKEILNKEEQMILSNQKIGGISQNLTAAELKAMSDFFRSRLGDIVTTRMKLDEKLRNINEHVIKLQKQINEYNESYNRSTSEIVVSLSSESTVDADLEINYVVANAGWHPVYDLRAVNTKKPLQLSYKANVYQATGEEWKNVRLTLSTANPNLGGVKPELGTWYLDFYYPVSRAIRDKGYGMMSSAPSIAVEDKKMEEQDAPIAESVADYVQTMQTTLNTEFDISLPYSVISSSKPTMVDIRTYEMKANYSYSVVPKLDRDAFLMAKTIGWEEFNLLPGEANIFFEGTFVGKSVIDPNNIKDTLSVSLGRDKRIVVKKEKLKALTSRKFIGVSQRESYAFEISVRNTKAEVIKITVEDQVPVAQNTQIEMALLETGGATYNKDSGKLVWELIIEPNESKKVIYKYEVKYPKDKIVSGL